eukprot:6214739-Pleurochrysis_carterae.AAC.1
MAKRFAIGARSFESCAGWQETSSVGFLGQRKQKELTELILRERREIRVDLKRSCSGGRRKLKAEKEQWVTG